MEKSLWITCGIPGSGKTTWIKSMTDIIDEGCYKVVSRDEIRASLITDKDKYFSKEKEVFKTYCSQIQEGLNNENVFDIFADATHLTKSSRDKLLYSLNTNGVEINIVYFNVPLEVCLDRNEKRNGFAYVSPTTIKNMYKQLSYPTEEEIDYWNYYIFWVDRNGEVLSSR